MKPPPITQADYIASLWESVKAGQITWEDVRKMQAEYMPRCVPHNAPSNVKIGGVPMCQQCIEERHAKR